MRARTGLALAVLAAALTASPAAASGATAEVDCGYNIVAQEQVTGSGNHFEGAGYGYATLSSSDHLPVTARVTCFLVVDGVPRASYGGEGTGVVAFAGPIEFDLSDVEWFEVCWEVDFLSDDTPTQTGCGRPRCYWPPEGWCPVEPLIVVLDEVVFPVLNEVLTAGDPTVCPVFATLPDAGPVTIDDEGDVHYAGEPVWDCPPYE